ncbi:response regulator transcription factor [Azospirillum sp. RWY-5-1]|uniref:Response regulator transcription factor n=1 Tax=Azospirillum oleiclasticum TaxID=2735135 RepID=A0ABX2T8W7_9PROT|nr:response regulator transcription factor [Azospirillum oleiclasticum]NYZ11970.1 response regulator transcription factor [Azospirillum oleiclasticum]NYZ19130.1 response regulator transcription factor [Azospirillum oleiclasticum]
MRLLIVEDEEELAELMKANLRRGGFAVDTVGDAEGARAALAAQRYDAVLLDLGLPDDDGLDVLAELRARRDGTPVIAVTARDGVADRVRGLNGGADDYLTKPFAHEELLARIHAVLRRPGGVMGLRLELANLAFDSTSRDVTVDGAALTVPRRELAVLEALLRRSGRVVVRDALESAVYAFGDEVESNALEAHVSRLRRRLGDAGARVSVHTVRGVGYLLRAEEDKPGGGD